MVRSNIAKVKVEERNGDISTNDHHDDFNNASDNFQPNSTNNQDISQGLMI